MVIGQNCTIEGTYIFENARIGDGCVIRDSIIGEGAVVGDGSTIEGGALVGGGTVLGKGARVVGRNVAGVEWDGEDDEEGEEDLCEFRLFCARMVDWEGELTSFLCALDSGGRAQGFLLA